MILDELNLNPILGDRIATYIPRFTRLLEKAGGDPLKAEKVKGWNWAAFFLTGFWLIYHRMMARGLVMLAILSGLPALMGTLAFGPLLVLQVGLGLFGDALLFKHIRAKAAIRASLTDGTQRQAFDRQHGGASPVMAWAMLPVFLLANALIEPEVRNEIAGLFGPTRSCSASATQDLLRQIANRQYFEGADQTFRQFGLTREDLTIRFGAIRELGADRRKTACAAEMTIHLSENYLTKPETEAQGREALLRLGFSNGLRLPITYDLNTTEDGRLYAEVRGLSGRR
jgi:hypothetical protein